MPKSPRRVPATTLALGALLALPAPALAAKVTVRVEGAKRTLVPSTTVTLPSKPVGKAGKPTCSGASALAALDRATRGAWSGPYYDSFSSYLVDTIKGEKHTGATFFSFWSNLRESSTGVCAARPRDGAQLLFFVGGAKSPEPLELRSPRRVRPNQTFTVVVRKWSAKGVPSRVRGAEVTFGQDSVFTDARGTARITAGAPGRIALRATAPGTVRSETDRVLVRGGDLSR